MNLTQSLNLVWPTLGRLDDEKSESDGTGELEKVIAMLVIGVGSFISGMLPTFISERYRNRFTLTMSLLLCFGAGILLATALVHILPEVRKQMNSNWAEIALCSGFFIIYFIDEFVHYFFGEALQHSHGSNAAARITRATPQTAHNQYGSVDNAESSPLLNDNRHDSSVQSGSYHHNDNGHSHVTSEYCNDAVVEDANSRICHTSHVEPCSQSMAGTLGLFVALSLHSAIEGIAIGVQNSKSKVLFLLGAVSCHKFVMGFCLGLVFCSDRQLRLKSHIIGISVFALGAVCGIGLGMVLVDIQNSSSTSALAIIQGLAGGTLFYVTVCEIIPREKAKWHGNSSTKLAGFAQFFTVALGFTTITIINFYLDDDA